jgi:hypothetical protein
MDDTLKRIREDMKNSFISVGFRQGGFIYLDGEDEEEDYVPRMRNYY